MTISVKRKAFAAKTAIAENRQIRVTISTDQVDRTGDVMVQAGIDLSNFKNTRTVLWNHDQDHPIASCVEIGVAGSDLKALVQFPDEGVSSKADEVYGLIRAGVINSASIGFLPIDAVPVDGKNARNGLRVKECELLEFSFVSVPANPGAVITERAMSKKTSEWKVGASKSLPIDKERAWDGPAAENRIFDFAGFDGDGPDPAKARKCFLVYDAANPDLRESYKLPFADIVDGKAVAFATGIDAAASRLPQADLPDDVQKSARAILDAYESKMKEEKSVSLRLRMKAFLRPQKKSLSDCASLAWIVVQLGWLAQDADYEREMEGDGSQMPERLGDLCRLGGEALVAMTEEEVAELLACIPGAPGVDAKAISVAVKSAKALSGSAIKSGRRLSSVTKSSLEEAMKSIMQGHDTIKALVDAEEGDAGDDSEEGDKALNRARAREKRIRVAEAAAL